MTPRGLAMKINIGSGSTSSTTTNTKDTGGDYITFHLYSNGKMTITLIKSRLKKNDNFMTKITKIIDYINQNIKQAFIHEPY